MRDDALRLVPEEPGALDDLLDVLLLRARERLDGRIAREQHRRHHVHALVGALRAQDRGDEQLERRREIELAVRVGIERAAADRRARPRVAGERAARASARACWRPPCLSRRRSRLFCPTRATALFLPTATFGRRCESGCRGPCWFFAIDVARSEGNVGVGLESATRRSCDDALVPSRARDAAARERERPRRPIVHSRYHRLPAMPCARCRRQWRRCRAPRSSARRARSRW